MAIVVYQEKAGYLRVSNNEFPLEGATMSYRQVPNDYLITIYSADRKQRYLYGSRLSDIEDNNDNTFATIEAWQAFWDGLIMNELRPYNCYTAYLTQTSTNAPVATKLEETISGLVWARTGVGTYTLTKVGAFTTGKTVPLKDYYTDKDGNSFELTRTSTDVMTLKTYQASDGELADGVLTDQYFHIEVYI